MVTHKQQPDGACDGRDAAQAEAIAFLSDPTSFDPPARSVTRIDTHGAIIFLAGECAYKIKRAVVYSYLDFSTLEKRRATCIHELKRNHAMAPSIYKDVVPIVRTLPGGLAIDKPGEPIEWVLRMTRFDQRHLFDQMARRGALNLDHMNSLSDVIARYHSKAPRLRQSNFETHLGDVITSTVASFTSASKLLGLDNVRHYADTIVQSYNNASPLLQSRTTKGYVRLCHGDLHLQNIVLLENNPTLFDAIEFDDEIATVDVLYDLAFVLMDLWRRNLKSHANILLNAYMNQTSVEEDLNGLALTPLFLALRAAIRAMVTLDRIPFIKQRDQRAVAQNKVRRYFLLARTILEREKPKLIAIAGRSGTGKTTLAAAIAPFIGRPPGAIHIRTDVERKRLFNVAPDHRLGPAAYTRDVSETVYRNACAKAGRALKAGHSAIIDAAFLSPKQRRLAGQTARASGAKFQGIWLEAEERHLIERVQKRKGDASDAGVEVVQTQLAIDPGHMSWHSIDADGSLDDTVHTIAKFLGLTTDDLKQAT